MLRAVMGVSWCMRRLEKNFQTQGKMKGDRSLLEWEMLLEQLGQAQGRTDIEQGSLVHFYTEGTRSGIGVFVSHLLIGWGQYPIQE